MPTVYLDHVGSISIFSRLNDVLVCILLRIVIFGPSPCEGENVASRLADQDTRLNQMIDWGQQLEGKLEAAGLIATLLWVD